MTVPSFADQRAAWRRVPVDDEGYLDAADLLGWPDDRLLDLVGRMERARYEGWRNHEGRWRTALGLDSTHGKRVLDYGCGVGLEALQYARTGNEVVVADVNGQTVMLAWRILVIAGYPAWGSATIGVRPRLNPSFGTHAFDVIHCAGVLHHIPEPRPTVELFHRLLKARGELRLMVYGPQAWRQATGTEPPEQPALHPSFSAYVGHMDEVGAWADWYDQQRLEQRFGDLFTVATVTPLGSDGTYLAATLTPKRKARR